MIDCDKKKRLVPPRIFAVSSSTSAPYIVRANADANPEYALHYYNDTSAGEFIRSQCGTSAYHAYNCFRAPAYRADLFRFCALYSLGGVYLDEDIILLKPIESVISVCSNATIGGDWDQNINNVMHGGKQMKIIAGRPGARIFKCMVNVIVNNVRRRYLGNNALSISGPVALHECYVSTQKSAVVTYFDARYAKWPYTGMRSSSDIFAFEAPNVRRHWAEVSKRRDIDDYASVYKDRTVYKPSCMLR